MTTPQDRAAEVLIEKCLPKQKMGAYPSDRFEDGYKECRLDTALLIREFAQTGVVAVLDDTKKSLIFPALTQEIKQEPVTFECVPMPLAHEDQRAAKIIERELLPFVGKKTRVTIEVIE